jgi:hypothetical protein
MMAYCERHGYDFRLFKKPHLDVPDGIYWSSVTGSLEALEEGYDRVVSLDVDQVVTNYDFVLPDWKRGFHASKDWGEDAVEPWQFSACGFVVHQDCIPFLKEVISLEPESRGKPFPEQAPMQHVIRKNTEGLTLLPNKEGLIGMFNIHERRLFNAVPDAVCPGKVPEPWQTGDFAAHITMCDLPRRIEIAKEILGKL